MTAAWPATLPAFLEEGAIEQLPDERRESGALPAQASRLVRGRVRQIEGAILCDMTQLAAFDTFFHTTLSGGVLPFTWVDPRTQAAATFRFRSPWPSYTPRVSGVYALVSFTLVQIE